MATRIDTDLNFYHTVGDNLKKTIRIKFNGSSINWASEGYASGKMQIRGGDSSAAPLIAEVDIDISTNGELGFDSLEPIGTVPRTCYYDIQFTMTDGRTVTWWDKPKKFTFIKDITT